MELANIEQLLEAYFEGNTTLTEEAKLSAYFTSGDVASHLQAYQALFTGFETARDEVSKKEVYLPFEKKSKNRSWWYGIAASLVIAIGVAGYTFSQPSLNSEEQEALAAFNKSKGAMMLLAQNFNKGAEDLALINQFTVSKNKILK